MLPVPPAVGSGIPTRREETGIRLEGASRGDRIYHGAITAFALCVPLLLLMIAVEVLVAGWPALSHFGTSFLTSSTWDPVRSSYGIAPAIYGTLVTSAIALVLATPLALGVAIFLSEFAPRWVRETVGFLVDLLAAIPSVVYGLWGIFVLAPFLTETVAPAIAGIPLIGSLPIFSGTIYPRSMFAAGVILAIMILPYISAVSREVLLAVPRSQREAALALGATKWEMISGAVLPSARSGIIGGIILGLGRALGETMAVTMLIGNRPEISSSVFAPGFTIASQIANQFTEATDPLQLSALLGAGFVLFVITLIVNAIARWLVWRVSREARA